MEKLNFTSILIENGHGRPLQKYAVTLRSQLDAKGKQITFGEGLSSSQLDTLSGEQISQLYALYEEIHKDKD